MATANDIIKKAISQIGVAEKPSGSNNVIYNTWYYGRAVSGAVYPWCCAFVNWVFNECGASDLFYGGKKTAYCPTVESYYRKQGRWFKSGKVGDLVLFDFNGKGIAGHIGIVEKVNADGTYTTIEGNTSTSNQSNGGCVMRRTRSISTIRGFARPNYGGSTATTKNTVTVTKPTANQVKIDAARSFSKTYAKAYKVTAKSGLNMRSGAGTNKTVIAILKKGATFRCYGYYTKQTDGTIWLYGVDNAGNTGYCSKAYLS